MRRTCLVGLSLLLLAACSFSRTVAQQTVAFNERFADSSNQQLLLNVARASHKHPLFFTSTTTLTSGFSSKGSLGLAVPFGENASAGNNVVSPGLEVSGGPSVQMGVLDSEKFWRGIMKPIDMELFQYLWAQGWPREMLLLLLVRRIVIGDLGGEHVEFTGYPLTREAPDGAVVLSEEFRRYHTLIQILAGYRFLTATPDAADEFVINQVDGEALAALVEAEKAGFSYRADGAGIAVRGKAGKKWSFASPVWLRVPSVRPQYYTALLRSPVYAELSSIFADDPELGSLGVSAGDETGKGHASRDESGVAIHLFLRSPEALVYHLGEIVRAENLLGRPPVRLLSLDHEPILFAVRQPVCSPCGVEVNYCGECLRVDGATRFNESMHVLSLLQQLLNLHKSAEELPRGGIVTLVGN